MTAIACLAWGSLFWSPRSLPMQSPWHEDGPLIPVEFARKSKRNYISLVIEPAARPVPTLWCFMAVQSMEAACEALGEREGTSDPAHVGRWVAGQEEPDLIAGLAGWADARSLDGVVWTALPPKFDSARTPAADEVLAFLAGLEGAERAFAERYVRRTHPQIRTPYRARIEDALGWHPEDS
ncbi:hypothetical protein [Pelagibius sp.]|uniref:hypothetical protein n=1 Tax=Pelagibius sp. TaxID=1931238 RepID=UPI00262EBB87|nr:hypothetical protein [Pelagibius sp.]